MRKGKINVGVLRKEASKAFKGGPIRQGVYKQALLRFEEIKRRTLKEFKEHPITQEIKGGPSGPNISNTLGGRGNLFSFIGFPAGPDPTIIIERLIQDSRIGRTPRFMQVGRSGDYEVFFNTTIPSKVDLARATPMPFEQGRSWVMAIEQGISGLSYFIYSELQKISASRSGKGIQAQRPYISGLRYRPTSYLSPILKKFKERLRQR